MTYLKRHTYNRHNSTIQKYELYFFELYLYELYYLIWLNYSLESFKKYFKV